MLSKIFTSAKEWAELWTKETVYALIFTAIVTIIAATFIMVFQPSIGVSLSIGFVAFVLSARRLIVNWRTIQLHIVGEIAEVPTAIMSAFGSSGTPQTGPLSNPLIHWYLTLMTDLLSVQIGLFMFLALFAKYGLGYGPGLIGTVSLAGMTVFLLAKYDLSFLRKLVRISIMFLAIANVGAFIAHKFPQIESYFDQLAANVGFRVMPRSTATLLNGLSEVRSTQSEEANNLVLGKAIEWQKTHPGQELPSEFQDTIEAARMGKTASEYRKWKENKKKEETLAKTKETEEAAKRVREKDSAEKAEKTPRTGLIAPGGVSVRFENNNRIIVNNISLPIIQETEEEITFKRIDGLYDLRFNKKLKSFRVMFVCAMDQAKKIRYQAESDMMSTIGVSKKTLCDGMMLGEYLPGLGKDFRYSICPLHWDF